MTVTTLNQLFEDQDKRFKSHYEEISAAKTKLRVIEENFAKKFEVEESLKNYAEKEMVAEIQE